MFAQGHSFDSHNLKIFHLPSLITEGEIEIKSLFGVIHLHF